MTVLPEILDRESALAFLYGRIDYERTTRLPYRSRELKLDRMRELLTRLGDPQRRFPIIHVAGTKGKGSTSALLAAMLTAAGYATGQYTSPHLQRVEERMTIDAQQCSSDEFVQLMETIRPVVAEMDAAAARGGGYDQGPTYFEITTAASLVHFARRSVDAAVLEVGLGGRLDSTNVCEPVVSVITSISFDHTRQLGNTLAAIAAEKAGIVKPGVPIVSGVSQQEPRDVIQRIAEERGSPCCQIGRDFDFHYHAPARCAEHNQDSPRAAPTGARVDFRQRDANGWTEYRNLRLGLLGEHQAANASVAMAAVGHLRRAGWHIDESAIRHGLAAVSCPARTELVQRRPDVVIDAAHNVASIQALIHVLNDSYPASNRRILIFATSQDKDAAGMLQLLLPQFDVAILTRYMNNPRFVPEDALATVAEDIVKRLNTRQRKLVVLPDPYTAWETAKAEASPNDLICVAGSFFLAAELRALVPAIQT